MKSADYSRITYYKGDITKPESLEEIFSGLSGAEVIVIHAAGLISIGSNITPQLYSINVQGTKNIIGQCMRHPVKRLVYVSSVQAIPETEEKATISEAAAFSKENVIGGYASTKAEATQAVLEAARNGLDAVVVHPSGIVGPYDRGNNHIVQLIKMYISGKLLYSFQPLFYGAGIAGMYTQKHGRRKKDVPADRHCARLCSVF